ncbi:MAG: UDP-N-acetylmuramate dehydrogenase [Deltaproteobacteria bacterium]|nr:UDP-N-acetylmuramate dehydrogenase [Deltaproteobacteria bacterium]
MSTNSSSRNRLLREVLHNQFSDRVQFDEPLAPYVAYRVGGPADFLVFPHTEKEIAWLCDFSRSHQLGLTVIGEGSNLLISDEGIAGLTLILQGSFQKITTIEHPNNGPVIIQCGGSVSKSKLLDWAALNGFAGLEFSAGIPGTVGGGIFMNAGTKYGTYSDVLHSVRIFNFDRGPSEYLKEECQFSYRGQSIVKNGIVIWAKFSLQHGNSEQIRGEIKRVLDERAAKQPLDFPSCGSTFKNPPGFSAGRLIEKAGLKGLQVGGAQVSEKHANFILNKGNATAKDIVTLIAMVREKVQRDCGILLECEVILFGGRNAQGTISDKA